jgi:hypothetical protein
MVKRVFSLQLSQRPSTQIHICMTRQISSSSSFSFEGSYKPSWRGHIIARASSHPHGEDVFLFLYRFSIAPHQWSWLGRISAQSDSHDYVLCFFLAIQHAMFSSSSCFGFSVPSVMDGLYLAFPLFLSLGHCVNLMLVYLQAFRQTCRYRGGICEHSRDISSSLALVRLTAAFRSF